MLSMEQMYQAALRLPDQRLLAVLQGKDQSLPQAVAEAALRMRKRMQTAQQGVEAQAQQGEPTQKDKLLAEYGGVSGLPAQAMESFAGGGIVSFAEGGEAYDDTAAFLLDKIRRLGAAGVDVLSLPGRALMGVADTVTAPLRAAGMPLPASPEQSWTPQYDKIRRQDALNATPNETDAENQRLFGRPPVVTGVTTVTPAVEEKRKAGYVDVLPPTGGGGVAVSGRTGGGGGIAGLARPTPTADPQYRDPELMTLEDIAGKSTVLRDAMGVPQPKTAQEYMAERRALMDAEGVNRDPYKKLREKLEKEAEKEPDARERAKNEAMLSAGLAMLAGRSRHFGVNFGEGAQQGLGQYRTDRKELDKQELDRAKALAEIEKANSDIRRGDVDAGLARRQKAEEMLARAGESAVGAAAQYGASTNNNRTAAAGVRYQGDVSRANSQDQLNAALYGDDKRANTALEVARIQAATHAAMAKLPAPEVQLINALAKSMDVPLHVAYQHVINQRSAGRTEQEMLDSWDKAQSNPLALLGLQKQGITTYPQYRAMMQGGGGIGALPMNGYSPDKVRQVNK